MVVVVVVAPVVVDVVVVVLEAVALEETCCVAKVEVGVSLAPPTLIVSTSTIMDEFTKSISSI